MVEATMHASTTVLDLGKEKDVADFLLRKRGEPGPDGGYESASSAESVAGDGDAVDLADDYVGRNNKKGQKRAVRLDEVGPRMELRLIKITEGLPGKEGAVLYHEFGMLSIPLHCVFLPLAQPHQVKKSKKDTEVQKAEHAAKVKLKKQRREEQERNVRRKKEDLKGKAKEDGDGGDSDGVDEGDGLGDWNDEQDISDDEDEEVPVTNSEESSEDEHPAKRIKLRGKD